MRAAEPRGLLRDVLGEVGRTLLRVLSGLAGVALVVVGAVLVLQDVALAQLVGLAVWLAAAVVVHDGLVAPLSSAAGGVLRAAASGREGPRRAAVVALVTAVALTLVAVPGTAVRAIGPRNPSVVPTDYPAVLAVVWAVALMVVLVALAVGLAGGRARSRRDAAGRPARRAR